MLTVCPFCAEELEAGENVLPDAKVSCPYCEKKFKFRPFVRCSGCGETVPGSLKICPKCKGRLAAKAELKTRNADRKEVSAELPEIARRPTQEWASDFRGEPLKHLAVSYEMSKINRILTGLMLIAAGIIAFGKLIALIGYRPSSGHLWTDAKFYLSGIAIFAIVYFIGRILLAMLPSTGENRARNDADWMIGFVLVVMSFISAGFGFWQLLFSILFVTAAFRILAHPVQYRTGSLIYRIAEEHPDLCPECGGRLEPLSGFAVRCPACKFDMLRHIGHGRWQVRALRTGFGLLALASLLLFVFAGIMGGTEKKAFVTLAAAALVFAALALLFIPISFVLYFSAHRRNPGRTFFYRLPENWMAEIRDYAVLVKKEWLLVIFLSLLGAGIVEVIVYLAGLLKEGAV